MLTQPASLISRAYWRSLFPASLRLLRKGEDACGPHLNKLAVSQGLRTEIGADGTGTFSLGP